MILVERSFTIWKRTEWTKSDVYILSFAIIFRLRRRKILSLKNIRKI